MKIDSVRYKAFATNSSSVHTPILVTGKMPADYLLDSGYDFGWGPFIAASPKAKQYYGALALRSNIRHYPKDVQDTILKDWVGLVPSEDDDGGYIDHQSIPVFPMEFSRKGISKEYFMAYYNWLTQPGLVMVGGNDNGEDEYPTHIPGTSLHKPYMTDMSPEHFVVRKDAKGFFTIFNTLDGTKIRMSFDPTIDMSKSTTPELVDLKITDCCDMRCEYCYQGSLPTGQHANSDYIRYHIIPALAEMRVFEVALGGGEPTAHPEFSNILYAAHYNGITPSFSTRRLDWLDDPIKLKHFKQYCGAFAYSLDNEWEVHNLVKRLIKADIDEEKVTIQYVPEAHNFKRLKEIMVAANFYGVRVTLLGYKKTGRGVEYLHKQMADCVVNDISPEQWKEAFEIGAGVSVDTAFAATHKQLLKDMGVADWSYKILEGAHSMYFDAVTNELAASSYVPVSERHVIPPNLSHDTLCQEMVEAFAGY